MEQTLSATAQPTRSRLLPSLNLGEAPSALVLLSFAYLIGPAMLQLGFWLRPEFAFAALAGTGLILPTIRASITPSPTRGWRVPAVTGLAVSVLAGAGGLLSYSGDWRKHFALLRDLTESSWPVVYDLPGGDGVLSYSSAWYLPAAGIGRVFGWTAANVALSAWLALGVAIAAWWVYTLVGRRRAIVIFLLFSGLDALGAIVLPRISDWWTVDGDTLETWPGEWQIPSVLRSVLEAPQHSLPTMTLAGLVLSGAFGRLTWVLRAAVLACVAVSSPFAAVAALPFILICSLGPRAGPSSPVSTIGGGAVVSMVGVLFLPRLAGPPADVPNEVVVGFVFDVPRFPEAGAYNLLIAFILVIALEALVLSWPLLRSFGGDEQVRRLIVVSMVTIVLCLMVRVGHNNDLAMRGPGMAVFVLAVLTAHVLSRREVTGRALVAVVFVIGSLTAVVEIRRNVTAAPYDNYSFTSMEQTPGLPEMAQIWYPQRDSLLSQYLVAKNGLVDALLATE